MNTRTQFAHARGLCALAALAVVALLGACTHQVPTIAHTHIGHAITAFDGTPGDKGLFIVAEERAEEASRLAANLDSRTLGRDQSALAAELIEVLSGDAYGLKKALVESESHVTFTGDSEDASANVRRSAQAFAQGVNDVVRRCDLATLLANDLVRSGSADESSQLVTQIQDLVDRAQNGKTGAEVEIRCGAPLPGAPIPLGEPSP